MFSHITLSSQLIFRISHISIFNFWYHTLCFLSQHIVTGLCTILICQEINISAVQETKLAVLLRVTDLQLNRLNTQDQVGIRSTITLELDKAIDMNA